MMRKILSKVIAFRTKVVRRFLILLRTKCSGTKVEIGARVTFNQKTIINGKGTVKIGDGVLIGYKHGGRFHGGVSEIQARYEDAIIEIGDRVAFNNNVFI